MRRQRKKATLGIVLTDRYVEAVSIEAVGVKIVRIRSNRIALAPGQVCGGWIQHPSQTAAVISKLLRTARIGLRRAVVVVPDGQTVAQILDLPSEIPSNMQKFIHTEIRYSPVLAKRTAYADYRSLGADEEGKEKILVGLTTRECIQNLVQTFRLAGVEIQSLEMDFCAVYRTMDSFVGEVRKKKNLLLASLTGQTLTLAAFLSRKLDFVQRFACEEQLENLSSFVLQQIHTVQQFYELERGCSFQQDWQIVVVLDRPTDALQTMESALKGVFGDSLLVPTASHWSRGFLSNQEEPISAAAFGAAWKYIDAAAQGSVPDLLPAEVREGYAWRKSLSQTVAASVLVVAGLYLSTWLLGPLSAQPPSLGTFRLIELARQQQQAQKEVETLQNLERLTQQLSQEKNQYSFSSLLKEIRTGVPPTVQIASLELNRKGLMSISGRALSIQAIHEFAVWLQHNPGIASAAVEESRLSAGSNRIYEYRILCRLKPTETGEQTDEPAPSD